MRFVTLLSILAILVCPLWCAAGICADHGEASLVQNSSACCCCHEESPGEEQLPSSQGNCQGVCGGAVLSAPMQVDLDFEISNLSLDATAYELVSVAKSAHFESFQPDNSKLAGQLLRAHLQLWTC